MTNATTSWHASSYQQTLEINGGPSAVSRKAMTTVMRQHPKVVEDEASMQVPMRFFSLTIKTAGVSLINEEEQLFATPLDNQGGT